MGNGARKIIDAVQNSLLDTLLLRLVPLWWIGSLWERRQTDLSANVMASLLAITLLLFAGAWALGAIANRRPEGVGEQARGIGRANGFEAWAEPPSGGLNPPSWLRAVVMVLSRNPAPHPLMGLVSFTLFFTAAGLLWTLSYRPDSSWIVREGFADGSTGDALWLASAGVVVIFVLRQWAVQQRGRLVPEEPLPSSSGSEWMGFGLLSIFVLGMVLVPSATFGWPRWIMVIPVIALAAIALFPRLRRGVLDIVFGKQDNSAV